MGPTAKDAQQKDSNTAWKAKTTAMGIGQEGLAVGAELPGAEAHSSKGGNGIEQAEGALTLKEYLAACMTAGGVANGGSEEGEDKEMAEWAANDEEEAPAERAGPAGMDIDRAAAAEEGEDLLWEGSLVVSGKVCPTIAAYLGGERMPIEMWPMTST
jgi:hypothetical protein